MGLLCLLHPDSSSVGVLVVLGGLVEPVVHFLSSGLGNLSIGDLLNHNLGTTHSPCGNLAWSARACGKSHKSLVVGVA
jgi:hypothetical protein